MRSEARTLWTFAVTSIALSMVVLDSVLALLIPRKRRAVEAAEFEPELAPQAEAA